MAMRECGWIGRSMLTMAATESMSAIRIRVVDPVDPVDSNRAPQPVFLDFFQPLSPLDAPRSAAYFWDNATKNETGHISRVCPRSSQRSTTRNHSWAADSFLVGGRCFGITEDDDRNRIHHTRP